MKKTLTIIFSVALLVTLFSSCKKVRESNLIKGLWELQGIYVDTMSENQMNRLSYFVNGNNCCKYRMDFQDNDIVFGYYLTYDSFNYVTVGTWQLIDYNTIRLKLDDYIDGEFIIQKPTPNHFKLTSDENHIKAFEDINPELDTAKTRIEMERI